MHNLQKPIMDTLVQGCSKNPFLAAGTVDSFFNTFLNFSQSISNNDDFISIIVHRPYHKLLIR